MKDVKDITALVFDHGLFLPIAVKLAETYKRVLYHTPWESSFPTVNQCVIGDGFEKVERCDDIWSVKNEVDLFIFPDIMDAGLQLELESQGFPVWGSRAACEVEMNREKFHRMLKEVGLEVPTFVRIVGVDALRKHLRDEQDKIIKISRFRGSIETCKWRDWEQDEVMLDAFAHRFGPVMNLIPFLVFDKIDTPIELGCDTFCIDGEFPDRMIQGYEAKDSGFISAVRETKDMPVEVTDILNAFGPRLKEYRYRNSFSAEIRVKDDAAYFIDPCCRFPMPPTGSKLQLWKNLPEVIWAGAHGIMVSPEATAKFAVEAALTLKMDKDDWGCIRIPDELRDNVKVGNCCEVDGMIAIPPAEFRTDSIGWLVVTGDTIDEGVNNLLAKVKELPPGLSANVLPIAELLEEIRTAEKAGIEFTDQKVPDPSIVVNN